MGNPNILIHSLRNRNGFRTSGLIVRIASLALGIFAFLPNNAQGASVNLTVKPASIQLAPGEAADVLAIVLNEGEERLRNCKLSVSSSVKIEVAISGPTADDLAPRGSLAWKIHLSGLNSGSTEGTLTFRLDYVTKAREDSPAVPGVAIGTLEIAERTADPVDKIVDFKIETAAEILEERRPIDIICTLKNISSHPVVARTITAFKPKAVQVDLPNLGEGVSLSPGSSKSWPAHISLIDVLQAGQHTLGFEIGLEWEGHGIHRTGIAAATLKLKAGVLGESDILKLLGIPSFFLLPGFLVVTAFLFLWSRVKPRKPFDLDAKSAEFWLIAITLSLFAAILYPLATDILGRRRDYLAAYGLIDIFKVWTGSLAVGAFVWLTAIAVMNFKDRREIKRRRRTVPSESDGPMDILRKLQVHQMGLTLRLAEAKIGDALEKRYYLISPDAEGDTDVWLAPAIVVTWTDSAPPGDQEEFDRLLNAKDLGGIIRFLEDKIGARGGEKNVEIRWQGGMRPTRIEKKEVQFPKDLRGRIVIIG